MRWPLRNDDCFQSSPFLPLCRNESFFLSHSSAREGPKQTPGPLNVNAPASPLLLLLLLPEQNDDELVTRRCSFADALLFALLSADSPYGIKKCLGCNKTSWPTVCVALFCFSLLASLPPLSIPSLPLSLLLQRPCVCASGPRSLLRSSRDSRALQMRSS